MQRHVYLTLTEADASALEAPLNEVDFISADYLYHITDIDSDIADTVAAIQFESFYVHSELVVHPGEVQVQRITLH